MYIDKYYIEINEYCGHYSLNPDDKYPDQSDNAQDFIHGQLLDFCGCGLPESNLEYVRKLLNTIKCIPTGNDLSPSDPHYHDSWNKWIKESSEIVGSEDALNFGWYFLNAKRLTTHGGSIPGWLTELGEGLLRDLEELKTKGVIGEDV